jgi:lipopolysaccharide export system protein LptA
MRFVKLYATFVFLFALMIVGESGVYAQKTIGYQSEIGERKPSMPDEWILKENVIFTHEGMTMFCDSAVLNKAENSFSAFGVIDIFQNDTIHLSGEQMYYDGNTKIAEIAGKVVTLEDGKTTLVTDYLVLERVPNIARYTTSAVIYDDRDTLESIFGTYFINDKNFIFTDRVKIRTTSSEIFSDTIHYNTKTNVAQCFGLTTIVDKDSMIIVTERGNYNTETLYCESYKATKMTQKGRMMLADTLFYDSKLRNGEAFNNICIEDTGNHINATGNYVNMKTIDTLSYTFLTDSAFVKQIEDKDTFYLHADTILLVSDTSNHARDIFAYNHAKLFRSDLQGAAEFAHYKVDDSLLTLFQRPVLWNEENQLTADTITVIFSGSKISQMNLYPNAFIVQDADTSEDERYNQIFGRHLTAYFSSGRIQEAVIEGNAQSIYYMWEEKKDRTPRLIGINIGNSSKMKIYFDKGIMKRLVGIDKPEYRLDDEDRVPAEERKFKGFIWTASDRPLTPQDIFIHRQSF